MRILGLAALISSVNMIPNANVICPRDNFSYYMDPVAAITEVNTNTQRLITIIITCRFGVLYIYIHSLIKPDNFPQPLFNEKVFKIFTQNFICLVYFI